MMGANTPHVGRPFAAEISENALNDALVTIGNVKTISVGWPLTIQNTQAGGIRIGIDIDALLQRAGTIETLWPVCVRDVRAGTDDFVTVQDVDRTETDPWDGLMRPVGESYKVSIFGHGVARDFLPLVTRETTFTKATPIVWCMYMLGQAWLVQYLRFDLIQPRDRVRRSDCVSAIVGGT